VYAAAVAGAAVADFLDINMAFILSAIHQSTS
jgi:hypothetical protein